MVLQLQNTTDERNYLDQARDLVLRVISHLDCTVFLFGSRAHGGARRASDIDIGISGLNEISFARARDAILVELEESIIPHHADIVDFDAVVDSFRETALTGAIVWKQSSRAS